MSDPNVWVITALVFLLGLLIGVFLTAGTRRKWKARYRSESERRVAIEREHEAHRKDWDEREREWRERDSRSAADRDRQDIADGRPV
jgi:hypothetical protein